MLTERIPGDALLCDTKLARVERFGERILSVPEAGRR